MPKKKYTLKNNFFLRRIWHWFWKKEQIKLFEAVGILLALGALYLDWSSVQHWTRARTLLHNQLESFNDDYTDKILIATIQLEESSTRILLKREKTDNTSRLWDEPSIRGRWMMRTDYQIEHIENILRQLDVIEQPLGLSPNEDKELMKAGFLVLVRDLRATIDPSLEQQVGLPVPDTRKLSEDEAVVYYNRFNSLIKSLRRAAATIGNNINEKSNRYSSYYKTVIVIGFLLNIVAKFREWWLEKKAPRLVRK